MSIFPFTQDVPELEERAAQELPVFRELAYDYENNCLKRKGGVYGLSDRPGYVVRCWKYWKRLCGSKGCRVCKK